MKLVFGRPGFVFCLMVNADYLEGIAHHRFGTQAAGERYLEKFVDLRLKLKATEEAVSVATEQLAMKLPLAIPFAEGEAFSVGAAAKLAGKLALESGLSFRQIERVLDRVEVTLRCYRDRAVDFPLLIFLAFRESTDLNVWRYVGKRELLPRARLTPQQVEGLMKDLNNLNVQREAEARCRKFVIETCPELLGLPDAVYSLGGAPNGGEYYDWYKVIKGLGPRYIPEHEAMLQAVHRLMA